MPFLNRVCLNMIVKNEAHVIERCLASVRPFIDCWLIVDTGSSDGTQDVIRRFLADIPGELHERCWVDFGHNRTQAMELARTRGDYIFVIDADEVLRIPAGFQRPALSADVYALTVEFGGLRYSRSCLVASRLPWRWVGVLHEYLEADQTIQTLPLPGPTVFVHTDGARSQQDVRTKFSADARVLETALRDEPDNSRYRFYLAQSYRDSGEPEAALQHYDQRVAMGGWVEEVWFSRYAAARLAEQLQHAPADIIQRYLDAYQCRPTRGGEALGQLARYCRGREQFALARLFAQSGMAIPLTDDRLFVDASWYLWRCRDEYAIASYWTGDYAESERACLDLLNSADLPAEQRQRVQKNLDFALQKLHS